MGIVYYNIDTSQFSWWSAIAIFNIITEAAIIALELAIMSQLHIKRTKKAFIMSLFACRVLYVWYQYAQ